MQTVRIQTSQNIDIDYEVASFGDRLLGRLIDIGIFIGVVLVFVFIGSFSPFGKVADIVLAIVGSVTYIFYDLLCEIFLNGQSLGKRVMKIKVVSIDGGRPSISQYLLRWIFRIVDFILFGGLIAIICVLVSEKGQRLGDMVAGTTLIKTTPRIQMEGLVFRPAAADSYVPVYNQVIELTDQDVTLIHEVLMSYRKTGNTVLVYNMANRIKDYLSIATPREMNDYHFLELIIKDYNHIAAHIQD